MVATRLWDNGSIANAGAVTFGSGITGITGAVSTSNSLYGTTANDGTEGGSIKLTALANGNYVAGLMFGTTEQQRTSGR